MYVSDYAKSPQTTSATFINSNLGDSQEFPFGKE